MVDKRVAHVGRLQIELNEVVRDPRGIEDIITEVMENEWGETRYDQFGCRLSFFADSHDIAEWDTVLLDRYHPLYTDSQTECRDCFQGPCELHKGKGRCGLDKEAYQGKLSLQTACRGCVSQMIASRQLLDYAIKAFGRNKPVSMGKVVVMEDAAPSICMLTGLYVKDIGDLDRVLSYAEAQLTKLCGASRHGIGSSSDFEGMTMHAGSLLFLAMDVAELVKISCFGFSTAGDQPLEELFDYPPVKVWGGLSDIDLTKPVIVFAGDDFLPAWTAVHCLEERGLREQIELLGIGAAGHDIIRFYDKARIVGSVFETSKVIRSGVADVLVTSSGCISLNIVADAERAGTKVISTGPTGEGDLADRTDDPIDDIVKDLTGEAKGAVIRDVEKAGEVAIRIAEQVEKRGITGYLSPAEKTRAESLKCKEDCDLCFGVCPNNLPISKAVRELKNNPDALSEIEKSCHLCGKCEEVCPSQIPLRDLMASAFRKRSSDERIIMRAGRGPIPGVEFRQGAFAQVWGSSPGYAVIQGCGSAADSRDIGFMADELASRNFFVWTAGCGAAEVARHYDEDEHTYIFEKYPADCEARSLTNFGSCSAHAQIMDVLCKLVKSGGGVSHYANYAEAADYLYHWQGAFVIMWGGLCERMYTMAAGYARIGVPVIIGPTSGFGWNRYLLGNTHDRSKWWMYDTFEGTTKAVEPGPRHLIIPVETKEEAITVGAGLLSRPSDLRDKRCINIETYLELHQKYFAELPDDWHLFVRSDMELPIRQKVRLLRELQEKHGWEVEGIRIKKARHPDGRLLTLQEYAAEYGVEIGRSITTIPRLLTKAARERQDQK